jgi:hypothetical protein
MHLVDDGGWDTKHGQPRARLLIIVAESGYKADFASARHQLAIGPSVRHFDGAVLQVTVSASSHSGACCISEIAPSCLSDAKANIRECPVGGR